VFKRIFFWPLYFRLILFWTTRFIFFFSFLWFLRWNYIVLKKYIGWMLVSCRPIQSRPFCQNQCFKLMLMNLNSLIFIFGIKLRMQTIFKSSIFFTTIFESDGRLLVTWATTGTLHWPYAQFLLVFLYFIAHKHSHKHENLRLFVYYFL
jgi:hypothetical protein